MTIAFYDNTDTEIVAGVPFPLEAGEYTAPVAVDIWHDRGAPGGTPLTNILIRFSTEGNTPDVGLVTGLPPSDELWFEARLVSEGGPGTPAPVRTDWAKIGAYRAIVVPDLPADGFRRVEVRARPPESATPTSWRFFVDVLASEHSVALPGPGLDVERGVLTGVNDYQHTALVRGGQVTPSATPDAQVHVAARTMVLGGEVRGAVLVDVTLDQDDGDEPPVALAAGQQYLAALTVDPGDPANVVVTKAVQGALGASLAPVLPVGHLRLVDGDVVVRHDPGGLSVIDASDIGSPVYDRYLVEPGAGRQVRVHPGQSIAGGTWRVWSLPEDLDLDPDATSWIWGRSSGLRDVTTTAAPPETSALELVRVTTDADNVIEIVPRQLVAGRSELIRLAGNPGGSPGVLAEAHVSRRMWIDAVIVYASDVGTATSGQTQVDVEINGVTIYTSFAIDDQRPTFAFDAVDLSQSSSVPEVTELLPGDRLTFRTVELPVGGSGPGRLECHVVGRF